MNSACQTAATQAPLQRDLSGQSQQPCANVCKAGEPHRFIYFCVVGAWYTHYLDSWDILRNSGRLHAQRISVPWLQCISQLGRQTGRYSLTQSINQSINQLVNQESNQHVVNQRPVNLPSIRQAINQSIHRLINQFTHPSINHGPINQMPNQSSLLPWVCRSMHPSINQAWANQSNIQSVINGSLGLTDLSHPILVPGIIHHTRSTLLTLPVAIYMIGACIDDRLHAFSMSNKRYTILHPVKKMYYITIYQMVQCNQHVVPSSMLAPYINRPMNKSINPQVSNGSTNQSTDKFMHHPRSPPVNPAASC